MAGQTAWRHLRAIATLPGVAILVVPGVILAGRGGWRGLTHVSPALQLALIAAGVALAALGLALMTKTISLFVRVGQGTLAPWDPPEKFVVRGIYRRVRNPMITGVVLLLLAEAALFASPALLAWFAAFAVANLLWIPLVEEPALVRRFGDLYQDYRLHVPRWIPRATPWDPPPGS
jgi:protein-S-isoprenylcysteine O-methyltransferase Ste14